MTIEAQLPGGTTLQFPDGTPDAIVQGAVKQQLSKQPDSASQTPESKLGLTPAPDTKPPAETPVTTFDEYGRPLTDGVPPSMADELGTAAKSAPPVVGGNAPGYRQSDTLPLARREDVINDPNSSWYQGWALAPGPLRALGQTPAENVTINPATGTLNLAPEALATASILGGAGPLRFSGKEPLQFVAPGTAERAPIPAGPAANILHPDSPAAARIRASPGEPVPVAQPTVSTPFNAAPTANVVPNAPSSPGIAAAFGQMGGAIGDNLRDYLWGQLQKGDLTEAGGPSTLLQTAKYNVDNGAIKTRADFDRFVEDYGNRQAAQRAAQQPQQAGAPTAGAPPASAGPLVSRTGVPVTPPAAPVPQSPLAPTVAPDGTLVPPQQGAAAPRTSAEAKQVASQYYTAADNAGGTLTPQFTNKFIDSVGSVAPQTEAGAAVTGTNAVTSLVDRLQTLRDKPMTLQAAQEVDEGLSNLIDKEYGVTGLSKDGKKLLDIQGTLRDQINNAGAGDTTGGTAGFDALNTARQAWSQAMKMGDLERIQARAAPTDNPATSIRTQVRNLITNQAKSRGYTPDEIDALTDAANRGTLGGLLHVFGSRLVPIAAGAAGLSHGPWGMLIGAGASHVGTGYLRDWATNIQQNRLSNAIGVVGQGVPPPPGPMLQ